MRTLHLYNPSHDEALAARSPYYYPSEAARQTARTHCALPLRWARPGDVLLVPDEGCTRGAAEAAAQRGVTLVTERRGGTVRPLSATLWKTIDRIAPWGWDLLVRHSLHRLGAPERLLPSDAALEALRRLSARTTTAELLPMIRQTLSERMDSPTVGHSVIIRSIEEAERLTADWGGAVAKSLWSCSGRGVFLVGATLTGKERARLARLLRDHGAVELEPVYEKLLDFALEFEGCKQPGNDLAVPEADTTDATAGMTNHSNGSAGPAFPFLGLSVFTTHAFSGYVANRPCSQAEAAAAVRQVLPALPPPEVLADAVSAVVFPFISPAYHGPWGIDMMVVRTPEGPRLHPCVEINLRRTMGHAAVWEGKKLRGEGMKELRS